MQDQDEITEAMTEEPIGTAEEAAQKAKAKVEDEGRKTKATAIKYPDGFTVKLEKSGRTLVGVIERGIEALTDDTYPYKYIATVYEGGRIVFSINTCPFGLAKFRSVLKAAMNNALMRMTHGRRLRENKKAKQEGGAK